MMSDMSTRTGYAIIRYDGALVPTANGRAELFVKVVKVFLKEDIAFQEAERLNALRRTEDTEYFVGVTRVCQD